jgi:purine catabolism regulator
VPDILPWVKPGELMLTTGYPLRHDPDALAQLVCALDAIGLAALGVKLNRYLDEVPAPALAEADRGGLPVIRLPTTWPSTTSSSRCSPTCCTGRRRRCPAPDEVHRALLQIVLDGGGLPEVAAGLVGVLGGGRRADHAGRRVLADAGDASRWPRSTARPASSPPAG